MVLKQSLSINLASFLYIEEIGHLALNLGTKWDNVVGDVPGVDVLAQEWIFDHVLVLNKLVFTVELVEDVAV